MKTKNFTVFIIEDNDIESRMLSRALTDFFADISVFIYPKAETAFENLERNPRFIILDHFLEGINGIDCIPYFKKQLPHAKIIVTSSQNKIEEFRNAYDFGADIYYKKNDMLIKSVLSYIHTNL